MNIHDMVANNQEVLVQNVGGVLVADSLGVAERFGKSHNHVMRDIDKLINDLAVQNWTADNLAAENSAAKPETYFIPSEYENRGKRYRKYLLTRDGFSLLVMGFTGTAALHWKLLYIEAFNKMEAALRKQNTPQLEDLSRIISQITTQVIQQTLPAMVEALKPVQEEKTPEPPKPKYVYALIEFRKRSTKCHYNGYDMQAVKCLASDLQRRGTPYTILRGEVSQE